MDLQPVDYQEILGSLPGTCIIIFDEKLNLRQRFDRDKILEKLLPEISQIHNLSLLPETDLKSGLILACDNAFKGLSEITYMDFGDGYISIQAVELKNSKSSKTGSLLLHFSGEFGNEFGRELIKKKEEAEETSLIKSRFMARISHEIRTPLNAITGFIEQLQKTELDSRQRNFTSIIDKSSAYLLDLVNEILSFSQLESGVIKLDEVDFNLESLFNDIYETLKVRAEDKGINLRYAFDERLKVVCYGDAFRLKQVVMNLMSNGIKFTDYGYVELAVSLIEQKEEQLRIRIAVSDTGIGIKEHKLKEIFEEYKQANAGIARKHGGTGLGLTISKRLTEVMKGRIQVESKEGEGSSFFVEIPLKKSEKEFLIKDILQINSEELAGIPVLLVDDDAMNRALGQIILESFNMKVTLAGDGREAMEEYKRGQFDVVLLDIHMPEVSGLEVADFIRNKENNVQIKIIAVTADMLQEDEQLYARHHIDDVLIKPYKEISIYNKICKVLGLDSKLILKESIILTEKEDQGVLLYDLSELLSVTRGNQAFFNEMIDTFISNSKEGVRQLRDFFEKENWKDIQETAHRLIPSFKHLGIKVVVSDLIEIKSKSAMPVDRDRLEALVGNVEVITNKVICKLENEKAPD